MAAETEKYLKYNMFSEYRRSAESLVYNIYLYKANNDIAGAVFPAGFEEGVAIVSRAVHGCRIGIVLGYAQ